MIRGKVVLVPFPFDDLSGVKVRPALCLTEPIGRNRHIVVAFLTSRIDSEVSTTDIVLDPSQPAFADLGLKVASTLRLHRITTITATLIRRELGVLSPALQVEVGNRLRLLFGL